MIMLTLLSCAGKFAVKAVNAQNMGATAVLMYMNTDADGITMADDPQCNGEVVNIPVIMFNRAAGLHAKNSLTKEIEWDCPGVPANAECKGKHINNNHSHR